MDGRTSALIQSGLIKKLSFIEIFASVRDAGITEAKDAVLKEFQRLTNLLKGAK